MWIRLSYMRECFLCPFCGRTAPMGALGQKHRIAKVEIRGLGYGRGFENRKVDASNDAVWVEILVKIAVRLLRRLNIVLESLGEEPVEWEPTKVRSLLTTKSVGLLSASIQRPIALYSDLKVKVAQRGG